MRWRAAGVAALLALALVSPNASPAIADADTGAVELSVLVPDGSPNRLAHFDVARLTGDGSWDVRYNAPRTETEPGHYRIEGLAGGTYRLYVRTYDYLPGNGTGDVGPIYYPAATSFDTAETLSVVAGETSLLETVHLPRTGSVSGRVTPSAGFSTPNHVVIQRWDGHGWGRDDDATLASGVDGNYSISRIGPGPRRIVFLGTEEAPQQGTAPTGYWSDTAPRHFVRDEQQATLFSVAPGTNRALESSTLTLNGTLNGRVLDPEGRPLKGASVTIDDDWETVTTGADGTWSYGPAHEGRYSITIGTDVSRALGYPVESLTQTATVNDGQVTQVASRLRHAPPTLSPVRMNFDKLAAIDEFAVADADTFPTNASLKYQWIILGPNRRTIKGATHRGLRVTDSLLRQQIAVRVTATAYGLSTTAYSVARPVVRDESALSPRILRPQGLVHRYYRGPTLMDLTLGADRYVNVDGQEWQWFRDGEPIAGATSENYLSTVADLGHSITGRSFLPNGYGPYGGMVSWTRASKPTAVTVPYVRPDLKALGGGDALLGAVVTADGVATKFFDGYATIYRRGRSTPVAKVRLVKGRGQVRVSGQPRGVQQYKVRYTPVRAGHGAATSILQRLTIR